MSVRKVLKSEQRGFTLIELLVVIVIIAILAALALVALNAAQKGARDTQRQSNIKQLQTALVNRYADADDYPNGSGMGTICNNNVLSNYFSGPCPPTPTGPYYYNSDGTTFTVCVRSERDTNKGFSAGPTETKTLTRSGGGLFNSASCTGVN